MFGAAFFVGDNDEIKERIEIASDGLGTFDFTLNAIRDQVLF